MDGSISGETSSSMNGLVERLGEDDREDEDDGDDEWRLFDDRRLDSVG